MFFFEYAEYLDLKKTYQLLKFTTLQVLFLQGSMLPYTVMFPCQNLEGDRFYLLHNARDIRYITDQQQMQMVCKDVPLTFQKEANQILVKEIIYFENSLFSKPELTP